MENPEERNATDLAVGLTKIVRLNFLLANCPDPLFAYSFGITGLKVFLNYSFNSSNVWNEKTDLAKCTN